MACLDFGYRPWYYFKDRYALYLLSKYMHGAKTIGQLKKSQYAHLLEKKAMKQLAAKLPKGLLTPDHLTTYWPEDTEAFTLSLGKWGAYNGKHRKDWWEQTSRPGMSLVLQLNFSHEHDVRYHKLFRHSKRELFGTTCHPVAEDHHNTLAWARLDVDLEADEVLVEELQTDWLRDVKMELNNWEDAMKQNKSNPSTQLQQYNYWLGINYGNFRKYWESIRHYEKIWSEAMLTAAIELSVQELGIRNIYYHSFETGNLLKGLNGRSCPPKSLYTRLPKKFGFQLVQQPPKLLSNQQYLKKYLKKDSLSWFYLKV